MRLKQLIKEVLLVIMLLIPLSCTQRSNGEVPCVLLKCTDFSSENDAYDNGVIKEICRKDCRVE